METSRHGNRYGIIVTDIMSKYAWGFPYPTKEAINVVEVLEKIVHDHGLFSVLQTDNGTEFVNSLVETFCHQNLIGNLIVT